MAGVGWEEEAMEEAGWAVGWVVVARVVAG